MQITVLEAGTEGERGREATGIPMGDRLHPPACATPSLPAVAPGTPAGYKVLKGGL